VRGVNAGVGAWHRTVVGGLSDAECYELHAPDLVRFATGLVGPADAADVVSSAFMRVLGSPAWPHAIDQRAYLFRAVLNEARMQRRGEQRRQVREARAGLAASVNADLEALDVVDVEVLGPIAALSVRQRAVVMLTYWQDMDQAAIASLLGITRGSVARHLDRAHARLRELIAYD
jgi:RNA polymerase sigma factor (sigma-70 family)